MEAVISIFLFLICGAYTSLIASYCFAWVKMKEYKYTKHNFKTRVSIIIAARNEEDTIESCLLAIKNQTYPTLLFNVIVVDDNSEDNTANLVRNLNMDNVTFISLKKQTGEVGKKQAIKAGIQASNGELIVTTDADCTMGNDWLASLVSFYEQTNAKMIAAPVSFHKENNVFEKMQTLEFMSLIASGAASIYFNKATLCNGANLAYNKKVFEEVNGFENIDNSPTGDDVLLMYKIHKKYPNGVRFLKSKEAIVFTIAKKSLREFIQQRTRWASKPFGSYNIETKVISLLVFTFNLTLFLLLFISLANPNTSIFTVPSSSVFFILFGTKCIIDFLFLFLASTFFRRKRLLIYFLPEELLYIFYTTIIAVLGSIGNYDWKNRQIRHK